MPTPGRGGTLRRFIGSVLLPPAGRPGATTEEIAMRLLCLIAGLLGALLAAAVPASAAGATHYQFSYRGASATAEFAGLPPGAIPQPGVVYTNTLAWAGESVSTQNGTQYEDGGVHLEQFSYRYTEQGEFQPIALTSGMAHGAAVDLTVSGGVNSASTAANVPVTRCEFDPATWSWSPCADAGSRAVSIAWTGTGDVMRGMSVSTFSSGNSRYVSRTNGTSRDANATGTVDGVDLGASNWGFINRSRAGSIQICHGC
jgi:hypothetical protein